jgi:2,3-bisphosphoglycerate-dependent phosphoglycerate mutase
LGENIVRYHCQPSHLLLQGTDRVSIELTIVRHGETELNRVGSFQGQVDVPLNARGLVQAQRLAQRLANERFDQLYCSDLQRALQTAAPIAQRLSLFVQRDRGLREQLFGVLDGKTLSEVQHEQPDLWQAWLKHDADFALPGGESVRQFSERVLAAVMALDQTVHLQQLLVVCHGGVLDMLYRYANGYSLHGPRVCAIPNTGINRFMLNNGQLDITVWGDDTHLSNDLP